MIDVEQSSLHCTVGPCLSILCVIRTQSTFDPLKSYKDHSRQNLLCCSILYCSIPFHQHYLKTYYVPTPVSVYLCFYHLLNEKALRGADESGRSCFHCRSCLTLPLPDPGSPRRSGPFLVPLEPSSVQLSTLSGQCLSALVLP